MPGSCTGRGTRSASAPGVAIDFAAYSALAPCDGRPELGGARFWASPVELAAQGDIDAFVELIGGADGIAFEAVKTALERGLPVVTANKAMLAEHGLELARAVRGERRAAVLSRRRSAAAFR